MTIMKRLHPLEDQTRVTCPYCGQTQWLAVDPDTQGELVEDCDVCCHPWRLLASRNEDGVLQVDVTREQ